MKCKVCGCPRGISMKKKMNNTSFYVQLGRRFEDHLTVPCFARRERKKRTKSSVMYVETPGLEIYNFRIKNKSNRTHIYGDDYSLFLSEYAMDYKDMVKFKLKNDIDDPWIMMHPKDYAGFEKERIREDYVFEEDANIVVFTKGVTLSNSQIGRINKRVSSCGIGLGAVFIHKLTPTDQKYLRIPKEIVSYLGIPSNGNSVMHEDGVLKTVGYYKTKDGRLCFKQGWEEFATGSDLEPGLNVLVLFHNIKGEFHAFIFVIY